MSNPVWPSTLPPPLARNPTYSPSFDNILKSPMDTGAIKRRPKATSVPEAFGCEILLNATQYATFKAFIETTLGTAGLFDWKDWRTNATQTYGFLTLPSYQHEAAGYWVASFELITA